MLKDLEHWSLWTGFLYIEVVTIEGFYDLSIFAITKKKHQIIIVQSYLVS